jgi:thioredoxin-related protein
MKSLFRTLAVLALTTGLALAEGWGDNWDTARAESKKTGKPILINLTGSDWCGWCIKLEKKVFSTRTFKHYAKENLILMEADFPRKKEQPAAVKEQNEKLRKEYLAGGYPTVWLLDHEGNKLSKDLGEFGDDPDKWVAKLKELVAAAKADKEA